MAIVFDILKHKIPNLLLVIILIVNLFSGEIKFDNSITLEESLTKLACLTIIFAVMFPFFSIGSLGAGDVKLILVTAIIMKQPLYFLLAVFLWAALISLIKTVCVKNVRERIRYLSEYVRSTIRLKTILPYQDPNLTGDDKKKYSIHLSVPIFLGAVSCFIINSF